MRVGRGTTEAAGGQQLFDRAAIPAAVLDATGTICEVNPALEALLDVSAASLNGTAFGDLLDADHQAAFSEQLTTRRTGREADSLAVRFDATVCSIATEIFAATTDLADGTVGMLVQVVDRRRQQEREDQLRRIADQDSMTGLLNRHGFEVAGQQLLELARREERQVTCMFIDVEGLKAVNDRYGHATGDLVIQRAGAVLRATFRMADVVARYGGDEFCVLALTNGPASAEHLHQRLLDTCANTTVATHTGDVVPLRITAGVFHTPADGATSLATLVDRGDRLMYQQRQRPHA